MFKLPLYGIINDTKEVTLYPGRKYDIDVEDVVSNKIVTFSGNYCNYENRQLSIRNQHGIKYIHEDCIRDIRESK